MSILSAVTGVPSIVWKIGGAVILCGVVVAGANHYKNSLIERGVAQESARRDLIDEKNRNTAQAALIALNKQILIAKNQLAEAQEQLSKLQTEAQSAQTESLIRESALRSGAERMRITVIQHNATAAAGPDGDSSITAVDTGTRVVEDLPPEIAGDLESLRRNENTAIDRLNACIVAYDAVKAAIEATQK